MNKKLVGGHIALILANVIFGASTPVTKSLMNPWISPESYTFLRFVFAALVFWGVGLFTESEKVPIKDLLIIGLGGVFGFVATQLFFAIALQYTTPTYFSLIMASTPVLVLLLSMIFLKEMLTKNKIIGVGLSIGGAVLVILGGTTGELGSNNTLGMILAFFAALSYALYTIITRNVAERYSAMTITKWAFLISAVILFPFQIAEVPEQVLFNRSLTLNAALELGFALIFATGIAFFLMPAGLKQVKATTASIYMNFQPIVASAIAIFIGQDLFSWDKVLAAGLVISGVYLVTRKPKRARPKRLWPRLRKRKRGKSLRRAA